MTGHDWLPWALVALLTAVWGSSFFLVAVALQGFAPLAIASGRVLLAAAATAVLATALGQGLPARARDWLWCAGLGVFGLAVPFSLLAWAQQAVPSGVAAIFIAGSPIFLLALTRLVFRDPVGPRKWAGFAVGLCGLLWLSGPDALAQISARGQLAAQAGCLAAALSFAVAALVVRAMPALPPLRAAAGSQIMAAALLLPFGVASLPTATPSGPAVVALMTLGLVQTGIAQFLRYFAVKRAGPVFMSTVGYLIPIWAGFLGVTLLGETLGWRAAGAYALILAGLVLAGSRPQRDPTTA